MSRAAAEIALLILETVSGAESDEQVTSYHIGERPPMQLGGAVRLFESLPKPIECQARLRDGALQISCEAILEPGALFAHRHGSAYLIAGWQNDFGPMARDNPAECLLTLQAGGRSRPITFGAWTEFLASYSISHTAGRPVGTVDVLRISRPAEISQVGS